VFVSLYRSRPIHLATLLSLSAEIETNNSDAQSLRNQLILPAFSGEPSKIRLANVLSAKLSRGHRLADVPVSTVHS